MDTEDDVTELSREGRDNGVVAVVGALVGEGGGISGTFFSAGPLARESDC